MSPRNYSPRLTSTFNKCLSKHQDLRGRLDLLIERILEDPYYYSHPLGNWHRKDLTGKRARHLTGNFVVVFEIVEHRKQVIFHAFGTHKAVYGA